MIISLSPHIHTGRTVRSTMMHVLIALTLPAMCSLYYFGFPAAMLMMVAIAVSVITEWAITKFMLRRPSSIGDLTAVVTGLLLAMNVPSTLPLWTVAIGSFFAIAIAKMAFGGLGCNIFNPAMVGRVFLLISFPALMTVWPLPGNGFMPNPDGVTGATLLSRLNTPDFNPELLDTADMLLGNMGGSLGEVGAAAILLGFVYLLATRIITWHIPVSIVLSAALFASLAGVPVTGNVLSGGLLLGAVFMATDYVTSPMTAHGKLIYGVFIGVITMIIRLWGAYPEGVSFAILLANGITPLIDRFVLPRRFAPESIIR